MIVKPKVELLRHTEDLEIIAGQAASLCYSKGGLKRDMSLDEARELLKKIPKKHKSILEHSSFTFYIEGISRVGSHQLVRYRIASPSQRSQRYVYEDDANSHFPDQLVELMGEEWVEKKMKQTDESYREVIERYREEGLTGEVANQDARYVLQNSTETKLFLTLNTNSLLNLLNQRMCFRAQDEIRNVANQMFSLVYSLAPTIFDGAGPDCISFGKCLEGKMSCGRQEELKNYVQFIKCHPRKNN